MTRPIKLKQNGRIVKVPTADAHLLLRTPEDVMSRAVDQQQINKWVYNAGYTVSRGDDPYERARAAADTFVYELCEDPERRTKIFPALPTNGMYALQVRHQRADTGEVTYEILDLTRSFLNHADSWRRLKHHLSTRFTDSLDIDQYLQLCNIKAVKVPPLELPGVGIPHNPDPHELRQRRRITRADVLDPNFEPST